MCDAAHSPVLPASQWGQQQHCHHITDQATGTPVMGTLGSACSPAHPAVASLNLGFPTSSFPLLFYRLQKACREASPTLEHKYLPAKKTSSRQSKPRQAGTQALQMSEGASISGGAWWPGASPRPQTPQAPPSLPTSFAGEGTVVRMSLVPGHTASKGSFIYFL